MTGAISVNSSWTTPLSRTTVSTRRRAARSPRLAKVMRRSARGRTRLAFAWVVVIRRCSNSWVARLASSSRSCAGPPPRRGPLVGVGMSVVLLSQPAAPSRRRGGGGWSELLVLGEGHVVVRTVAVDDERGVEPGRAVLEREAHPGQLLLDLVDRLGAEVADVEQVGLAAGDQLPHRVDALALEAVVGADREVELLDRQRQVRGQRRVGRRRPHVDTLGLDVQLTGQAEELDQRLSGARHRVAG